MAKRRAYHDANTAAEAKKRKRQLAAQLEQRVDEACNLLAELARRPHFLHKEMFAPLIPHLKTILLSQPTWRRMITELSHTNHEACGGNIPNQLLGRYADGQPQLLPSVVTRGFVKQLYAHQTSKPADPVLLVCGSERRKTMSSSFAAGGMYQPQIRLVLVDGDNSIAAVVATQFAKQAEWMQEPGSILRISKYTCVGCSPEDNDDVMLALLIHKAEFVTCIAMDISRYPRGMTVDNETYFSASVQRSGGGDGSVTNMPRSSGEADVPRSSVATCASQADDRTSMVKAPPYTSTSSTMTDAASSVLSPDGFCDGTLCSICGIRTTECMMRREEMPALEAIAEACYFADEPVDRMQNSDKRFLLYWWWAVNIFAIRGQGMHCKLPECIMRRIQKMYPNPPGVPYTGFNPQ